MAGDFVTLVRGFWPISTVNLGQGWPATTGLKGKKQALGAVFAIRRPAAEAVYTVNYPAMPELSCQDRRA